MRFRGKSAGHQPTSRCSERAGAVRVECKVESRWRLLPVADLHVGHDDGATKAAIVFQPLGGNGFGDGPLAGLHGLRAELRQKRH